jgi:hypothetical protein
MATVRDLKLINSDFASIGYAVIDPRERSRSQNEKSCKDKRKINGVNLACGETLSMKV